MSRVPSPTRPRPARLSPPPPPSARAPLIGIGAVVTVALVVRLPSLLEPHYYGDEGIFAAAAQRLLQGHALYQAAWDDKPPLVYWLYAGVLATAGPSMIALRIVAAVAAGITAAAVVVAGRVVAGPRAALAAGLLVAMASGLPVIEGNLTLTELLGAAPASVAMALILTGGPRKPQVAAAGACLALATLFKQVFALEAAVVAIALALRGHGGRQPLAALALGFALPVALTGAVLALSGALGDAAFAVVGFYAVYLREGSGVPDAYRALKLVPPLCALAFVIVAARRRGPAPADLLTLWLGFATLGATVAARPFGHYLLQPLAPLALAVVATVPSIVAAGRRSVPAAHLALPVTLTASALSLAVALGGFWWSHPAVTWDYYGAIARRRSGDLSRESFEWFFSWRALNQRRLAELIGTDTDRTLFVWGDYPWLYPLAGADNPTRYVTSYHTSFVPGAKAEVMAALRRTPPRYIVWEREEWRRLPGLAELVTERYERVAVVDATDLYRRRDARP